MRNQYSVSEIQEYISFMKGIFDVVRLVDPVVTAVIDIGETGEISRNDYECFRVWNKEERCENCTSLCAHEQMCRLSKYEYMQNNIFYVVSQPITIIPWDGNAFECVLEIVSRIPSEKKEDN